MIMKNKRGSLLLRNLMFLLVVFSTVLALSSIFVGDMATTYGNNNVTNEYAEFGANTTFLQTSVADEASNMNDKAKKSGAWNWILSFANGIGTFLILLFKTPIFVSEFLASSLKTLGISSGLYSLIKGFIASILYIIIAFGVGTAISRGSKM